MMNMDRADEGQIIYLSESQSPRIKRRKRDALSFDGLFAYEMRALANNIGAKLNLCSGISKKNVSAPVRFAE
jgi:hypothetical protein